MAPVLVKQVDPANSSWNSQNPKWNSVLELVASDIRTDLQRIETAAAAAIAQVTVHEFAVRCDEVEIDALIRFFSAPEGVRYLQFQRELAPLSAAAVQSLVKQQPMPAEANEKHFAQRLRIAALSIEVRIDAEDKSRPADPSVSAVAPILLNNTATREGAALDKLDQKYHDDIAGFVAFSLSATGKHFFAAYGPAIRAGNAESTSLAKAFADAEATKYMIRWRKAYGQQIAPAPESAPVVGSQSAVAPTPPKMVPAGATGPGELAAMKCESKANFEYAQTHKPLPDTSTQYAALIAIRDKCRADLKLTPMSGR